MFCPSCGKSLTVHSGKPGEWGWEYSHYCEECLSFIARDNSRVCPSCKTHLQDFLRTGHLGCSECYVAFREEILPVMDKYFAGEVRPGEMSTPVSSLAQARSEELMEIVLNPWKREELLNTDRSLSYLEPEEFNQSQDRILISTRVRLARNIAGVPYLRKLGKPGQDALSNILLSENFTLIRNLADQFLSQQIRKGHVPRSYLESRQESGEISGTITDAYEFTKIGGERLTLYCGDEDHLRVQWILPGRDFRETMRFVSDALKQILSLDEWLHWQYLQDFGYLGGCPSNSGAGIRVSWMLDLSALYKKGHLGRWKDAFLSYGMEIRGKSGEGSDVDAVWQLSMSRFRDMKNVATRLNQIQMLIKRLIQAERDARKKIFSESKEKVEE